MIVDRINRERLASAIRQYLAGESTSFEFDEIIHEISETSEDMTITFIASSLWSHYDDCRDHTVVLSKEEWDYFYRIVLVLESDAHIHVAVEKSWSQPQLCALIGMLFFFLCAARTGFGYQLLVLALPFGFLSIALSFWGEIRKPQMTNYDRSVYPFSSAAELLAVRRSVKRFIKLRYPETLCDKRIRSRLMWGVMWVYVYVIWMVLSPLVLALQILPERTVKASVQVRSS